jgi:hypothetical protein
MISKTDSITTTPSIEKVKKEKDRDEKAKPEKEKRKEPDYNITKASGLSPSMNPIAERKTSKVERNSRGKEQDEKERLGRQLKSPVGVKLLPMEEVKNDRETGTKDIMVGEESVGREDASGMMLDRVEEGGLEGVIGVRPSREFLGVRTKWAHAEHT